MQVENLDGFVEGGAVMIASNLSPDGGGVQLSKDTVVGIDRPNRRLLLSRRLERDAFQANNAHAATSFALLTAIGERGHDGGSGDAGVRGPVSDVKVSDIVLDGNGEENSIEIMSAGSNGNYAGAVFLQHAHRFTFTRVGVHRSDAITILP
eukprot:SAG31_NODE_8295_length_1479_cov_1.188406_2_plen_151_part_00